MPNVAPHRKCMKIREFENERGQRIRIEIGQDAVLGQDAVCVALIGPSMVQKHNLSPVEAEELGRALVEYTFDSF